MLLSAPWFRRVPLLWGPEHKAAISLTHFSCLVQHMKRPEDNKPRSFGITVTMRGKHNCTQAWVSLKTHYAVERRSRARATEFPPIVIAGKGKKRDPPNVTSSSWRIHRGTVRYKVSSSNAVLLAYRGTPAESLPASCKKLKYSTLAKNLCLVFATKKKLKVCAFLAGWLVVCGPRCLHTSSVISSLIRRCGFGRPCHIPLATHRYHKHRLQRAASRCFPASRWFSGFFL